MPGKIKGIDATESGKGVSQFSNYAETIAGQIDNKFVSPKNLNASIGNAISALKFTGFKFEKLNGFTQLEPNTIYICSEPAVSLPKEGKLPARGAAKEGDIIIVYNLTTKDDIRFKVTLNESLILHHDGIIVEDIDGKYLLGDKGGSCVLLGCGGGQQWYSYLHYQITLTAGE